MAYAPPDFVGVMNAAIDVRTPSDTLVDRSVMRLEWIGKRWHQRRDRAHAEQNDEKERLSASPEKAITQPIHSGEAAVLIKQGNDYLKAGDLVAARTVLRRAADAGSAEGAIALGSTFDPFVFKEFGVIGFAPDAAQARAWYKRAGQLGSAEGARRIDRLSWGAR
jgi:TPR repeat protein